MATATAESPGSDKATLKRLLKSASQEAVNAAIALDAGGAAIILLDKRKNPRGLLKQLKDDAPDSRNHRFGTVAVVAEQKLVRFTLDKQAGAMLRKLVVALKGTGYRKIEIGTEGANDFESADSDDDASDEPAPEDPPREDPDPAREIAALTRRLTDLVRKLGSTGTPPPKPAIDLARTIKAALAANDDKTATTQLDALQNWSMHRPLPTPHRGPSSPPTRQHSAKPSRSGSAPARRSAATCKTCSAPSGRPSPGRTAATRSPRSSAATSTPSSGNSTTNSRTRWTRWPRRRTPSAPRPPFEHAN